MGKNLDATRWSLTSIHQVELLLGDHVIGYSGHGNIDTLLPDRDRPLGSVVLRLFTSITTRSCGVTIHTYSDLTFHKVRSLKKTCSWMREEWLRRPVTGTDGGRECLCSQHVTLFQLP